MSPARYEPFNSERSLGIDRANYIALCSDSPAKAAKFAVDHMGFYLVHVDSEGRHYLAAHGLDPYSLVYLPGRQGALDHISFCVRNLADLSDVAARLSSKGVDYEKIDHSPLWRHASSIRFKTPSGHTIELTPGVPVDIPMASLVAEPRSAPGPIAFDHGAIRTANVDAEFDFATRVMGLKESARQIEADGRPFLGFFRSHTLFHCLAIAASKVDAVHHIQFTLKNPAAIHAAYEKMKAEGKVELIWGPLRHGVGHNVAFYFLEYTGTVVEYSTEEEIILNDAAYVPRAWLRSNPRTSDEWNQTTTPAVMR